MLGSSHWRHFNLVCFSAQHLSWAMQVPYARPFPPFLSAPISPLLAVLALQGALWLALPLLGLVKSQVLCNWKWADVLRLKPGFILTVLDYASLLCVPLLSFCSCQTQRRLNSLKYSFSNILWVFDQRVFFMHIIRHSNWHRPLIPSLNSIWTGSFLYLLW